MIRVAVCIRGQLRTWKHIYKLILDKFHDTDEIKYDFYYHTWEEYYLGKTGFRTTHKTDVNEIYHAFNECNKVVTVEIDKCKGLYECEGFYYPMIYGWHAVNLMKRKYELYNNMVYDYVMSIRPDVIYDPVCDLNEVIKGIVLNDDNVSGDINYPGQCNLYSDWVFRDVMLSDLMFCGDSLTIDILSDHLIQFLTDEQDSVIKISHIATSDYLLKRKLLIGTDIMESVIVRNIPQTFKLLKQPLCYENFSTIRGQTAQFDNFGIVDD